jgi:hypothetical protein
MLFCDLWQELLGFGGEVPNKGMALSLQESYTQQWSSSRKTLALLWKAPPIVAISDPLPLHSCHYFQDRLVGMEHSLSQLNDTMSLIAQALCQLIAAPQEVSLPLQKPLNSDASLDGLHRSYDGILTIIKPKVCGNVAFLGSAVLQYMVASNRRRQLHTGMLHIMRYIVSTSSAIQFVSITIA